MELAALTAEWGHCRNIAKELGQDKGGTTSEKWKKTDLFKASLPSRVNHVAFSTYWRAMQANLVV